eukprot:821573-Pyramimonas_sp.AAC.1
MVLGAPRRRRELMDDQFTRRDGDVDHMGGRLCSFPSHGGHDVAEMFDSGFRNNAGQLEPL